MSASVRLPGTRAVPDPHRSAIVGSPFTLVRSFSGATPCDGSRSRRWASLRAPCGIQAPASPMRTRPDGHAPRSFEDVRLGRLAAADAEALHVGVPDDLSGLELANDRERDAGRLLCHRATTL